MGLSAQSSARRWRPGWRGRARRCRNSGNSGCGRRRRNSSARRRCCRRTPARCAGSAGRARCKKACIRRKASVRAVVAGGWRRAGLVAVEQDARLGRRAVGVQRGEHVFHHRADVAANRHVGLEHAAELRGVAVDLGDFLVGQQLRIPQIAGAFVEARRRETAAGRRDRPDSGRRRRSR